MKKILIPLLVATFLMVGCSTMTSLKRVDYVAEKRGTSNPTSVVYLCRPMAFHMFATYYGVTINQSAIADIGIGEIMAISLPKSPSMYLAILIPDQNPIAQLLNKQKEFGLRLTHDLPANYVIFTTTAGDSSIDGLDNMLKGKGGYEVSGSYNLKLQEVSKQNFEKICPSKDMSHFTHKSL